MMAVVVVMEMIIMISILKLQSRGMYQVMMLVIFDEKSLRVEDMITRTYKAKGYRAKTWDLTNYIKEKATGL